MQDNSFEILPSKNWSDDQWYKDQENRILIKTDGWKIINNGFTKGTIIGGNLCTFNLLQGTDYFPEIDKAVLFVEDDEMVREFSDVEFDRNLQSIINLPQFNSVSGIIIGRFQKESKMTIDKISKIIKSKKEINHLPVIANVDFGHTDPKITFPIGGEVSLDATNAKMKIKILRH